MTSTSFSYRVLIVDDHPIVRNGLRQLFEGEPGFTVCGDVGEPDEARAAVARLQPDLVLVDLSLRGSSGLDLIRQLHEDDPQLPVLVLSMLDEMLFAERARQAGARGYVMKGRPEKEVFTAARRIMAGHLHFSNAVEKQMLSTASLDGEETDLPNLLTERELEVFLLLGQGYKPRHIAERLDLSISTVEVYRQHLKEKLHLNSAAELTRYAVYWSRYHEGADT